MELMELDNWMGDIHLRGNRLVEGNHLGEDIQPVDIHLREDIQLVSRIVGDILEEGILVEGSIHHH
jgi:hypothetical protein